MKYTIEDHIGKVGDTFLHPDMILRSGSFEGPTDTPFGILHIYPAGHDAVRVHVGDEVEIVSEHGGKALLDQRKEENIARHTDWRDNEEMTRSFDPSNESW